MDWDWNNLSQDDSINVLFTQIIRNPFIPVTPTEKQLEFLSCFNKEILYGGAAGGGKSAALLMAALMFVTVPEYRALLLRRTYADLSLPGALIDLSKEWLEETDAHWNEIHKQWKFPSGATLNFGYLDNEKAKYRYLGAQFHFVGFDELTQFTASQYLYLFSRNRKIKGVDIPLRFRTASNPGGMGHEWVKQRFITERKQGRLFIPAKLFDNPHLDQESYEKNLNELDPVTRKQLKDGDWNVVGAGNFFQRDKFNMTDAYPVKLGKGRSVRYWDLAATESKEGTDPDYTVGVKIRTIKGEYWVEDVVRGRYNPRDLENVIRRTAEEDGKQVCVFMEQEPGSSGKITISHFARNVLQGFSFKGCKTTGSKVVRAKPFSAAVENSNVNIIRAAWNTKFLEECIVFPQEGFHDDQVDAASGAFEQLNLSGIAGVGTIKVNRASSILEGY